MYCDSENPHQDSMVFKMFKLHSRHITCVYNQSVHRIMFLFVNKSNKFLIHCSYHVLPQIKHAVPCINIDDYYALDYMLDS